MYVQHAHVYMYERIYIYTYRILLAIQQLFHFYLFCFVMPWISRFSLKKDREKKKENL